MVRFPSCALLRALKLAAPVVVLLGSLACLADDATWVKVEEPVRFLRLARLEGGEPKTLEAAIVRCEPADGQPAGLIVDLVSAVHVAEPEFYAQLNREFSGYESVLYELVAPEGTRVPKDAPRNASNPLSLLQHGMTDVLKLQFQLEGVDYSPKNLVHADMSPDQFSQSMEERGENVSQMVFRMMGYSLTQRNEGGGGTGDARMLWALLSGDRAMALRRIMAEQFETMQGAMAAMDGPDGSTLIAERNKVALNVLRKELDDGKRKIAVFYGAGHMDDMLTRLRDDFGLAPTGIRWLTAWKLQ
ncbi:MAG: hypothetical protein U1E05_05815 [Patescibacteria group bacterium]|nr:hypothetical protein [Patescibacteria group bacterium]